MPSHAASILHYETIKISIKQASMLFLLAFIVRAIFFVGYIQYNERYQQPDSIDYHIGAYCIASGFGMTRPDTKQPIFWRTPGYPAYLSIFYKYYGAHTDFAQMQRAHTIAIWVQILFCSLMPLLVWLLAYELTGQNIIAYISSLIAIFHLGSILTSTYILTDGLGQLLFIAFLIALFKSFSYNPRKYFWLSLAALLLCWYTWLRPMGQIISIVSSLLLLVFSVGNYKIKLWRAFFFIVVFFVGISPWYIRNYNLTGSFFFCPVLGPYLTCFCAPKILARIEQIPLEQSHRQLTRAGGQAAMNAIAQVKELNSSKFICTEQEALSVALPWIYNHPLYFIKDWLQEIVKTTFDLHASQLSAFASNSFKWDPLIEYLSEKLARCLYKQNMPLWMHIIVYIEFISSIISWLGIFSGVLLFVILPLRRSLKAFLDMPLGLLWLKVGTLVIFAIAPTGGFGYARLRLPVDAILIILSVTFYVWAYNVYCLKKQTNKRMHFYSIAGLDL